MIGNKFHTTRFAHVITAGEGAAGFAAIPFLWDAPFPDTNYTISVCMIDTGAPSTNLTAFLHVHDVTKVGATAHIIVAVADVGETFIFHCIGIGD